MAERVGQGGPMDETVGATANGSGSTWTPAAPCDNTGDNSVAPGQKTQSIDNRSSVQSVNTGATAADAVATVKPLQIRGRFFTAVALRMAGEADQAFFDALDEHLRRMPHFFDHAPFVLDLEQAEGLGSADELIALIKALQRRNLSLFGVQNGTPQQVAAAARAGLIALSGGREAPLDRVGGSDGGEARRARRAEPAPVHAREPDHDLPASTTRLVTEPVRSGPTIFADCGDLVVVASVSAGAELIATGNIHVYGQRRGRALAGVAGDTSARIFCQSLDAELLAVAGLYLTSEDLDARGVRKQRVQAFLREDRLHIEALR